MPQKRWLFIFALSLALLIGATRWSDSRLASFRQNPFDFYSMGRDDLFIVDGLTRRQGGSVKLGFAEGYEPPEIGLYGNHIFRFFGSDAFGRPSDPAYFFNYHYANLALPETYRYLLHLEQIGHLPKKLILVQITSPNLDNGAFIINFGYELPPDLMLAGEQGDGALAKAEGLGAFAWQIVENWLYETLNYSTFILSFTGSSDQDRVLNPATCQPKSLAESVPPLFRHAPWVVQDLLAKAGIERDYCQKDHWWSAFRRDGSGDARYLDKPLIKDMEALDATDRSLKAGDEDEIARQMRAINAIGLRNHVKVVFIVPPAFESNRDDSVVNQIFNRALAMVPDVAVIDDRELRDDPSLFADYYHPSPKYFSVVVAELRRRGLLNFD